MAKKQLSKGILAVIIIVAVLVVLAIAGGIYCGVTDQNPKQAITSVFSDNESKLVGKWESTDAKGISAYVFSDDGTYDNYLSTINFSGKYYVKGNELTLVNPDTNKEIKYKIKISGKTLTMTLLDSDGSFGENDISTYESVDELNQKTFADIIGELVDDNETTEEVEETE